jgi:hypothetical protein
MHQSWHVLSGVGSPGSNLEAIHSLHSFIHRAVGGPNTLYEPIRARILSILWITRASIAVGINKVIGRERNTLSG